LEQLVKLLFTQLWESLGWSLTGWAGSYGLGSPKPGSLLLKLLGLLKLLLGLLELLCLLELLLGLLELLLLELLRLLLLGLLSSFVLQKLLLGKLKSLE